MLIWNLLDDPHFNRYGLIDVVMGNLRNFVHDWILIETTAFCVEMMNAKVDGVSCDVCLV